MKWVEMKIVTLSRRDRSIIICQNWSRAIGSTPEVGSSRISISGWWIIATARLRALALAERQGVGQCVHDLGEPEALRPSRPTRPAISSAGTRKSWACSSRFCRTVSSE